ncbi:AI-2E family transporter [Rickettsiales endosymbiont of Paramecium tredecaurelia]|uniref:AI-2E family transporter n=1 Tax=Candidatus Sarmatiella mevalonica TaxID=2770581 RepID=UPI001920CBE3|nr:AI-2E family transporter [Candidatus Sarmatiella mevalonica]MBL3284372.1 AI-2E family transporter [Candidatus Sarmatiella mevalonica]
MTAFFLAFALAYLFNPLLHRLGLGSRKKKVLATFLIVAALYCIFYLVVIFLFPLALEQLNKFFIEIPQYKKSLSEYIAHVIDAIAIKLNVDNIELLQSVFNKILSQFYNAIYNRLHNLLNYAMGFVHAVIIFLVTPILLAFILSDFDKIYCFLINLMPVSTRPSIKQILPRIAAVINSYIRGQFNICLLLSAYYCLAFAILKFDFSMLFGILSGFSVLVPFFGITCASITVIIINLLKLGVCKKLLYIVAIYAVGIGAEAFFVTPKIIGDKIGLKPIWILFALTLCGHLFGFIGVLLASPIAGTVKILLEYFISLYKTTDFYKKPDANQ